VWEEGLKPPFSGEVVLAVTQELALKLGRRRAPKPVLVTVQAQAAARRGVKFTGYGEELYLAPALPRDLLQLPPPPPAPERPAAEAPRAGPPTPGSFFPDLAGLGRPPAKLKGKGKKDEPTWKSGARALRKQRNKGEQDSGGKGEKGKGRKG
jgi:putative RNA 2'-phosphotransferase